MPNSAVSQTGFLDPLTHSHQASAQSYSIYCSVCLEDNVITKDIVTVSADHGTIVHVTETQVLGEPNFMVSGSASCFNCIIWIFTLLKYSASFQGCPPVTSRVITPWKRLPVYTRGCGDRTLFPLLHCHTKASCGSLATSRELHDCHPAAVG